MDILEKLRYDLSWDNIESKGEPIKCNNFILIFKILKKIKSDSFHAVLLIRLYCYFSKKGFFSFFKHYYSYRLKRRYLISVYDQLEIMGGLRLPHPYGIILGHSSVIGKMVTIGQFVTLGGNMGRKKGNRSTPTIGNWSMISANTVIAGPVIIGEDVIIGACSLITKDIEDHSIVSSASNLNIKKKEGKFKDSIVYNKYYNFPLQTINNFTT